MPLPATSEAAKAEFALRVNDFEKLVDEIDAGPDWAKRAFVSAARSMPLFMAIFQMDGKAKPYMQGFMAGMLADDFLPLMSEVEVFAKSELAKAPTDQKLISQYEVVTKFTKRLGGALKKKTGEALTSGDATSREFLDGLNKWKKVKPPEPLLKTNDGQAGNLATTPHLYLAVFWRGFAELRSLKEAYFALFCMFDKSEALAGTYEAFRKRARAIGLTYPKES